MIHDVELFKHIWWIVLHPWIPGRITTYLEFKLACYLIAFSGSMFVTSSFFTYDIYSIFMYSFGFFDDEKFKEKVIEKQSKLGLSQQQASK